MTEFVCSDQDKLYRQAKMVVSRGFGIGRWNEKDNPAKSSAFKIFQQLANENYGKAYYPLSCLFRESQDDIEGAQDRAQYFTQLAFDWCLANQANQDAELWCDLGEMYYRGFGTPKDNVVSAKWYRLAADQGHAGAQSALGAAYSLGHGVPQDYEEALRWQRLAADQGCDIAQLSLGFDYHLGKCVPEDNVVAAKWYRLAADQDLAEAQYYLGDLYKRGLGVPQDNEIAAKWLRLAAAQGYEDAQIALINLEKRIAPR